MSTNATRIDTEKYLVVSLHALAERMVDNKTDIQFIDSHSERICCTDHLKINTESNFLI